MELESAIEPENATYKEIDWKVSDESIASIDENGVLIPCDTGIVSVTATAKSGVTEKIEIEIYSNIERTVVGIVSLAMVGGGGTAIYYKRKKKKE